jgi:hypothetical protein
MNDEPNEKKKSPALALMLAFAPTAMVLVTCVASGRCCFTSSFMLFRRKTGLAIFGGILFLLLNGFITLFFGCTAMLSGI